MFYERLYFNCDARQWVPTSASDSSCIVSTEDVKGACKNLQRNKTCAQDALVAEMLQTDYELLLKAIAEMFTDILNGLQEPPEAWRQARLTIIFKKSWNGYFVISI